MANPLDEYFEYDPRKDLEQFSKIPYETWMKIGEQKALENFQIVSKAVPAYRDFLQKNNIDHEKIKTIEDFKKVPLTTKENYFKKYSLKDLIIGGDLTKTTTFHSSSGSSGKSLYWPKSVTSDVNIYKGVELLYVYYFNLDKVKTLFINCFGMGPWAAGEINHTAVKSMADKGLKVSVISPGTNVNLFLSIFLDLASNYDQIVIGAYPSFLKIAVDEGLRRNINFKLKDIKLIVGGEKFSENWRTFLIKNLGLTSVSSIASVLGTSETGITSISTFFTDKFRSFINEKPEIASKLFERKDLPSITQVITPSRFVEIENSNIIVTCLGFVPLIRYDTRDKGAMFNPETIAKFLPKTELDELKISAYGIPNLPVLTIDGRSDGAVIFYGANIYPEQIGHILELPEMEKFFTGRFEASTHETENYDTSFQISFELKPNIKANVKLVSEVQSIFTKNLRNINSEYSYINSAYGQKTNPIVELKEFGSKEVAHSNGKAFKLKVNK